MTRTFLPQFDAPWVESRRAMLEQRYSTTLLSCAAFAESTQDYERAANHYQTLLTLDPLDEHAHAGLMRCYTASGHTASAIYQYHRLRRTLRRELGVDPLADGEATQLFRALLQAS
jgi:DNA-binding SARP family transcriptional activator